MNDPPKRNRRRFQFSLRTLMIVVTLLAVPCGYVGWQAKMVRERKSILERTDPFNGPIRCYAEVTDGFGDHAGFVELPWIRRWLGDNAIDRIDVKYDAPPEIMKEVEQAFPEAAIFAIPPNFRLSGIDSQDTSRSAAQPSSLTTRSRKP